jgi:hypothetical protein
LTDRRFFVKVYIISGKAKNAASCASAGSPIDFVSAAGLVTVPKDMISDDEVTRIILLVD